MIKAQTTSNTGYTKAEADARFLSSLDLAYTNDAIEVNKTNIAINANSISSLESSTTNSIEVNTTDIATNVETINSMQESASIWRANNNKYIYEPLYNTSSVIPISNMTNLTNRINYLISNSSSSSSSMFSKSNDQYCISLNSAPPTASLDYTYELEADLDATNMHRLNDKAPYGPTGTLKFETAAVGYNFQKVIYELAVHPLGYLDGEQEIYVPNKVYSMTTGRTWQINEVAKKMNSAYSSTQNHTYIFNTTRAIDFRILDNICNDSVLQYTTLVFLKTPTFINVPSTWTSKTVKAIYCPYDYQTIANSGYKCTTMYFLTRPNEHVSLTALSSKVSRVVASACKMIGSDSTHNLVGSLLTTNFGVNDISLNREDLEQYAPVWSRYINMYCGN